jgi:excisionase family DNA binding protein
MAEQELLTVNRVAAMLGISRVRIYELINEGRLESVKLGRLRRIPADAVDDFVRRLRAEAVPAGVSRRRLPRRTA